MLLTTGEKERIFTDAIQSFYYNQRQMLDDDDFDKLKEDLAWEGSPVSSRKEPNIENHPLRKHSASGEGRGRGVVLSISPLPLSIGRK